MLAYWKTLQEVLTLYICFPMRCWMTTYLSLELQVHLSQCSFVDFFFFFKESDFLCGNVVRNKYQALHLPQLNVESLVSPG